MKNYALIFAGGIGSRMRSIVGPKQFMRVKGKPILAYTLEQFQKHSEIDGIYLVVRHDQIGTTQEIINDYKFNKIVQIVADPKLEKPTALKSINNGLEHMHADGVSDDSVVLIHDGVRPIVSKGLISKNIENVKKFGTSISAVPAKETIAKLTEDSAGIEGITVRSEMAMLQAPQGFRFGDIYKINQMAKKDGLDEKAVDNAELNIRYSRKLHLTEGLEGNVKITVPLDFAYFEFLVESGKYQSVLEGKTV